MDYLSQKDLEEEELQADLMLTLSGELKTVKEDLLIEIQVNK